MNFDFSRQTLQAHSLEMRQFTDARQSTLPNGMRLIEVYNGSGLTFTLLPDRGLDIWTAHYNGLPLTWISAGSPHPPDYGSSWLHQFNGALLTTCGLIHAGPPEVDDLTGEQRDVHGNYTRLRASNVQVTGRWDDHYTLIIEATMTEASLFGPQLQLTRAYTITLGDPTIHISDRVTNLGDSPTPLMLLYHINVGYPLVAAGTTLTLPAHTSYPRDEAAHKGASTWNAYEAPSIGYPEQVFYHQLVEQDGITSALLHRAELGFLLQWQTDTLPYFTQWKNTRQGQYVSGIEPGNCIPEGQQAASHTGRLQWLHAGESQQFSLSLAILDGPNAIAKQITTIESLQSSGQPIADCHLHEFSPIAN